MKVKTKPLAILARETLEKNIRNGTLSGQLPPERVLCEQLGISRPVLREALTGLQKDRLIVLEGQHRCICKKQPLKTGAPLSSVYMLCQTTEDMVENEIIQTQAFLAEALAAEHIEFHFLHSRGCFVKNAGRFLEPLTETHPHALWILYRSTPDIQKWFSEKKLPAIVLGSLYNGICLPNIDTDYANICRHATGLLTGRGHRHAALIRNSTLLPGDQVSTKSFEREWLSRPDRRLTTAEHDGSTESICKAVDRLLSLSNRPTAWFVFGGRPYLTVSSQLALHQLRCGQDIHLLCRDSDSYFSSVVPSAACYQRNTDKLKIRLYKMSLSMLNHSAGTQRPVRIAAEFHDGKSLGRLPC